MAKETKPTAKPTVVDQNEIYRKVWQACDTFRGVVDPSEYKNYILTFLFLKYLSDVWKDHYERFKQELGDDETRIRRKMDRERFILPEKCTFDYIFSKRNENNVGEIIDQALAQIEDSNKSKLEGIFRNISFNSEAALGQTKDRNRRLKTLIEDFADPVLDFRPSRFEGGEKQQEDIIGNAYIYLISLFASDSGKKGGEFYTPREVAILLAKLIGAKKGSRIYDPACGSASLLFRVADEIEGHDYALYGQEVNGSTWALAKMNMFLHGIDNARIEWGDTINSPKLIEKDHLMKFDVVVANPPFSLDKWGAEHAAADPYKRFTRGVPPKSKGDYAFILHMIESAFEGKGRVGVIVPHGVLFRGSSEGKIRQQIIDENLLDAVIGLPPNLFFGTGIPAAILIFDKGKKTKDVMFIDASREFEEGKNQNKLRDMDIEKIVKTYKSRKDEEKYAHVASADEIKENEYNLNIPRYVDTFEEEEEIDIKAVQREIEGLESELVQVRKKMNEYLKELGL
jgi:type I restriction enzyme M protein